MTGNHNMAGAMSFDGLSAVDESVTDQPGMLVGEGIRRLRKTRGMTLEALSEFTGLSTGHLSQIERDLSSPTLKAMFDISRALGVHVGWFFSHEEQPGSAEDIHVLRGDRRKVISYSAGIRDCLLSTSAVKDLEVLLSTFAPGAEVTEAYSHAGEECGLILSGQFELWIEDEVFLLNQNDSFSFSSEKKHRYRNPGITETVVVWCVSPPSY